MIIGAASSKGGVGKSTVLASIALEFARQGETVLVYDMDRNRTLQSWAARAKPKGIEVRAISPTEFRGDFERQQKANNFAHILIDLAGVLDAGILLAMSASDFVIIPSGTSQPDIVQAMDIADIATRMQVPHKVLLTRVPPLGSNVSNWAFDEIARHRVPMFEQVMVERTIYKEIFVAGKAPHDNLKAGAEVYGIIQEIKQTIKKPARKAAA